jgi:hypothetical protein
VRYLAWATTLAPILTNFSRSVVSVQSWRGLDHPRSQDPACLADAGHIDLVILVAILTENKQESSSVIPRFSRAPVNPLQRSRSPPSRLN